MKRLANDDLKRFVIEWQRDTPREELAAIFGITPNQVSHLADEMRKKGVRIKRRKRGPSSVDVGKLNAMIEAMS